MTDIMLRDIDDVLAGRIRRVAELRGWDMPQALQNLLEQGLHAYEGDGSLSLADTEADVLQSAISALEQIPDGVFARIEQA